MSIAIVSSKTAVCALASEIILNEEKLKVVDSIASNPNLLDLPFSNGNDGCFIELDGHNGNQHKIDYLTKSEWYDFIDNYENKTGNSIVLQSNNQGSNGWITFHLLDKEEKQIEVIHVKYEAEKPANPDVGTGVLPTPEVTPELSDLSLTFMGEISCYNAKTTFAIKNDNDVDIEVTWELLGTDNKGTLLAKANQDNFLVIDDEEVMSGTVKITYFNHIKEVSTEEIIGNRLCMGEWSGHDVDVTPELDGPILDGTDNDNMIVTPEEKNPPELDWTEEDDYLVGSKEDNNSFKTDSFESTITIPAFSSVLFCSGAGYQLFVRRKKVK